jgi:excisionase family DNA binding protein
MDTDAARLLTVREVSDRLQISERQVWTMVQTGELKSLRLGRSRRVALIDLLAYLDARRGVEQALQTI